MSKKLFAALSLSVFLVACQGSVTTESAIEGDGGAMVEDTPSEPAMMEETSSESGTTVEMDVNAEAEVIAE